MGKRVTAQQVADLAGVSQSAVSRVYSPGAPVSKLTEKKVRKAATELGYRPNVLARSLITGKSRIIGLVVGYLQNQFHPEAIEKFSNALAELGYHALIFIAPPGGHERTEEVIDDLLDYQVDGIITASVGLSNDLTDRCRRAGIPIVLFNRHQDDRRMSSVCSENVGGARRLAEYLVATGHRRIAHIAGWDGASTQREREKGFLEGLERNGQTLYARGYGGYRYDKAAQATREMFGGSDLPDAVFAANDHMAFAVIDVLRYELGLRVPEDVSVVGYDDVALAAWPCFNLTTVRQPANRMVNETVRVLMECIATPDIEPTRIVIDGPLIERGTVSVR